jgi:hypothetical protein
MFPKIYRASWLRWTIKEGRNSEPLATTVSYIVLASLRHSAQRLIALGLPFAQSLSLGPSLGITGFIDLVSDPLSPPAHNAIMHRHLLAHLWFNAPSI